MRRLILVLLLSLAVSAESLPRPDGTPIYYTLARPVRAGFPILVILQGSEYRPADGRFEAEREYLLGRGVGVLVVEKPGIGPGLTIQDYLVWNTIDRRLLDYLEVFSHLRGSEAGWDGRLILVGGSEGGLVAGILATLLPETRATVLISSVSTRPMAEWLPEHVVEQMRAGGAPAVAVDAWRAEFEGIRAACHQTPDSREWASDGALARNTYRFWDSILEVRTTGALEKARQPTLVLLGSQDESLPSTTVAQVQGFLADRDLPRVTLWTRPMGHVPPPEVLRECLDWALARISERK
ncbi:MAG: alpha/beta hydrolase [Candidatus Eremiobacteraeota bacterium]|nr:alpha/beta hydrolase [Candidatus Eremiobacteraeota bacterium]